MTRDERRRVSRAIAAAEAGTTGRIAVRVIPDSSVDAFERAKHEFGRTGLHTHPERNAALVLVAPKARRFAVIGDRAIHERVGDAFWSGVVREIEPMFARNAITDGIVAAVERIGTCLHQYFPAAQERPE